MKSCSRRCQAVLINVFLQLSGKAESEACCCVQNKMSLNYFHFIHNFLKVIHEIFFLIVSFENNYCLKKSVNR